MKTIKNILTLCALSIFLSCNAWLDTDLINKVDEDKMFQTEQGFKEALAGVYSMMSKTNMYGANATMKHIDLYAQYYSYNEIKEKYEEFRNYNHEDASVKAYHAALWRSFYKCISQVNIIIHWCEKQEGVLNENTENQILGECYALRALLHFDVYRLFCHDVKRAPEVDGIPYNKEFGVSLPPMYNVNEVVQLVINDLHEAEKFLQNDPINKVVPYEIANDNEKTQYCSRINLYGVYALKARVYQARGDKNKAIENAKKVIESDKFRLLDFDDVDQDEKLQDVLFSDEHIFSLLNKELNDISVEMHYPKENETSSEAADFSFKNVNTLYESNVDDVRFNKWFSEQRFIKYNLDNDVLYQRAMPMIKLSEMYLIIAESQLNNDKEEALHYVNTLRDHRIRNNTHWSFLNDEYIYKEMEREYLGEGQMWYVYKRNHLKIAVNSVEEFIEPSDHIFVFPLPMSEIENGNRN